MSTNDFYIGFADRVDTVKIVGPGYPNAYRDLSAIGTPALLLARNDVSSYVFYRWIMSNYRTIFRSTPDCISRNEIAHSCFRAPAYARQPVRRVFSTRYSTIIPEISMWATSCGWAK